LTKLLAHRLGTIFACHPILHPSQRGFVNGGTTAKCIDELLDAWDWSRQGKRELYTLLYDIKQAYDSVQVDMLVRGLPCRSLSPVCHLDSSVALCTTAILQAARISINQNNRKVHIRYDHKFRPVQLE
jgi:hypothetical protein